MDPAHRAHAALYFEAVSRILLSASLACLVGVSLAAQQSAKPVTPIAPAVAHAPAVMNAAAQAELVKQVLHGLP